MMVHSDGALAKAEDAPLIVRRAINFARPNTSETPTRQIEKKKACCFFLSENIKNKKGRLLYSETNLQWSACTVLGWH